MPQTIAGHWKGLNYMYLFFPNKHSNINNLLSCILVIIVHIEHIAERLPILTYFRIYLLPIYFLL